MIKYKDQIKCEDLNKYIKKASPELMIEKLPLNKKQFFIINSLQQKGLTDEEIQTKYNHKHGYNSIHFIRTIINDINNNVKENYSTHAIITVDKKRKINEKLMEQIKWKQQTKKW